MSPAAATEVPFLELRTQHARLRAEIDRAIGRVLESGRFVLGPELEAFERAFAAALAVPWAVGVASGTDALELALRAAGVGAGDEVVTAPLTAVATVAAIEGTGARAVLADVDPEFLTLDAGAASARVTSRTRAIVPVHLYGQVADLGSLDRLCRERGLALVEDACQAHGAAWHGRPAGSVGAFGCFSFYPTKNLGACGDAGIVVGSDPRARERVRALRNYGEAARFEHLSRGVNSRLDELQAAILAVKLEHLAAWNARRREIAARYTARLAGVGLGLPVARAGSTHVYCSYVVRHPARDDLRRWLAERGVEAVVQYPRPVHLQPAYADLGCAPGSLPESERAAREVLSLPVYPELTDAQVERVVEAVRAFPG